VARPRHLQGERPGGRRCLASHGWDRVVVVNGHGGNVPALGEVCSTITRHDDAYAVPFTWFDAVGDHAADMGHAGPSRRRSSGTPTPASCARTASRRPARAPATAGEWTSHANLAHDVAEFTENGVVGDPTEGDAARGEELLSLATDALCDLLDAVADRDVTRPPHR